ncbi:MAG TPA: septation protein SpoVG [Elusimicrobia bacterium]|nr:septation protein SpoVG [Elusimicrobiota bacterium]HBT61003.1 septation protein SpoVG [Elusimicrobiota bacterium]
MEITEIRVHLRNEDKLKAFATVTFDNCFVVRNMKIIEGNKGLILCMPSRKMADGTYKDVAHPINMDFRKTLEDRVISCYQEELKKSRQERGLKAVAADEPRS